MYLVLNFVLNITFCKFFYIIVVYGSHIILSCSWSTGR